MTWFVVDSDGNESEEIDSKPEAKEQRRSMEQLGKDVKLREVGAEDDEDAEPADDIDTEIIEMSREDGGNSTDTDDDLDSLPEPRAEIKGYRRTVSLCPCCGRWSTTIYRCECGKDLTNEPNYRGDLL